MALLARMVMSGQRTMPPLICRPKGMRHGVSGHDVEEDHDPGQRYRNAFRLHVRSDFLVFLSQKSGAGLGVSMATPQITPAAYGCFVGEYPIRGAIG